MWVLPAYVNASLLFLRLRRAEVITNFDAPLSFCIRLLGAVFFMVGVVYILAVFFGAMDAAIWQGFDWSQRLLRLCSVCVFGVLVYILALSCFGFSMKDIRGPSVRDSK